jgi:hypothetical protein
MPHSLPEKQTQQLVTWIAAYSLNKGRLSFKGSSHQHKAHRNFAAVLSEECGVG